MRARRESKKRETDRIRKRREEKRSPFLKSICICHFFNYSMPQHERDVLLPVRTLMLTIKEQDLHSVRSDTCNASCVRPILEQLVAKPDPGHRCQLWNIRDPSTCRSKWWTSSKQKSSSTMSSSMM